MAITPVISPHVPPIFCLNLLFYLDVNDYLLSLDQLGKRSLISAWTVSESLRTTALVFKVSWSSMLLEVALVLALGLFCWSDYLLIMAKNQSLDSLSIRPLRSQHLLLSPTTVSFQPIPFLSTLMLPCFWTMKQSMTYAGDPLTLSAQPTPISIAWSLR